MWEGRTPVVHGTGVERRALCKWVQEGVGGGGGVEHRCRMDDSNF